MANEITNTGSGTDWISLILPLLSGLMSGQSWGGQPQTQVNNTGPLTPEGAALWSEYNSMLKGVPEKMNIGIGGQRFSVPNRQRLGILKAMMNLDRNRNSMATQPPQQGIAGNLAQLSPMLLKSYNQPTTDNSKNNSLSGILNSGMFNDQGYSNQPEDTSWLYQLGWGG